MMVGGNLVNRRAASMSNVPDDVLHSIFDFIPVQDERHTWLCTWHVSSMMLVCKRWARLFEQHLYRSLMFHWGEPRVRPHDILKVLKQRPHLCGHVQDITFVKAAEDYDEANYHELLNRVLPISRFVTTTWSPQNMTVLHRLAQARCLSHLHVTWLSLCTILRWFGDANLKSLSLSRVNWQTDSNDWPLRPFQWDSPEYPPPRLQEIHPNLSDRMGSLKHLSLAFNSVSPEKLSMFLRWPAALETFEYLRPLPNFSPSDLQPLLNIHKSTLRRISIGRLGPQSTTNHNLANQWSENNTTFTLDLSTYPALTHLTLDVCENFADQSPTHLATHLSAPNLRHLTMDFSLEDYAFVPFQSFTPLTPPKLTHFISTLRSLQPTPTSFTSLHLDFHPTSLTSHPDDPGYITAITDDRTYPWDYLTSLQGALAQHEGVRVTWHEMDITHAQWDREVRAAVKRYDETGRVTMREIRVVNDE